MQPAVGERPGEAGPGIRGIGLDGHRDFLRDRRIGREDREMRLRRARRAGDPADPENGAPVHGRSLNAAVSSTFTLCLAVASYVLVLGHGAAMQTNVRSTTVRRYATSVVLAPNTQEWRVKP